MKTIAELRKALKTLKARGLAIVEEAEAADSAMTEDQEAAYAAIEAEIKDTQAQLEKAEELDARRRAMAPAGSNGANRVHDSNPELTGGFNSLGEFAVAVHGAVTANVLGGQVDQRLAPFAAAPSGTHQGGGNAGEGFSLPPQFRNEVWELVSEFDEFGPLIDEEPTAAREVKLQADETTPWGTSGIKAYWRAEATQMTDSELADEGRSVPLHELYTLAIASEELLEDAPRLENRLTRKAAQAIAWKKNEAIVEGSGVGQPLGWMNSKALVTVPKESGQAAGTINANNLLKVFSRNQMITGSPSFWLVNEFAIEQLATLTIGDRPVWLPPGGLQDAPAGMILGRPARFSPFCEELGSVGDIQLVTPRGYYGVRRTQGINFASSIHLYFDYNLRAFRWIFRYGGQPHLAAPIKPNKGTTTKSHFVTLAART
ncbi:MAG: phage major capsid protein [Pseudomonadota bacterium]